MIRQGWILAALLLLLPASLMAETIEGKLDSLNFHKGRIKVDGVVYEVITEATRIMYNGETMSEEDLRPGDDVQLILGQQRNRKEARELEAIILVRGSKPGLES